MSERTFPTCTEGNWSLSPTKYTRIADFNPKPIIAFNMKVSIILLSSIIIAALFPTIGGVHLLKSPLVAFKNL